MRSTTGCCTLNVPARAASLRIQLWAITLFPRGFDQVIPQVLALFLFYFPFVFPVGMTRAGALFGR